MRTLRSFFCLDCWKSYPDRYSGGWAITGDAFERTLSQAKLDCAAAADTCKAITCDSSNEKCTLRASSNLRVSDSGKITYKCEGGIHLFIII